ncbi:MAG: MFS transporter [Candidatus Hodarchaeales archaeon]|jgi:MFS family permease
MIAWIHKRLDIAEMNSRSRSLALKYYILNSTQVAQVQIASTFLVLFLLEIISFEELGILFTIQYVLTALLDYPTSALGDVIGHKRTLSFAYLSYTIAILFLVVGDSFQTLIPYAVMNAFGQSQESGALRSWFDNNYRITSSSEDTDRRIFGAFLGKMSANFNVIRVIMYICSGIIASVISRKALFMVQIGLIIVALLFILVLMNEEEGFEYPQTTFTAYFDRIIGGIKFVVSSKGIFCYFVGISLVISTMGAIWANLMIFPFYQSYSGSDEYIALLRTLIIATGIIWGIVATRLSKKSKNPLRPLFLSTFMINLTYFAVIYIYYTLVPPEFEFVLIKYLGVIIIIQWVSIWGHLQGIFMGRLEIDLIPDKVRNTVYSLQPTFVVIFSIPFVLIGGFVLSNYGFLEGCILLLLINSFNVLIFGLGLFWLTNQKKSVVIKDIRAKELAIQ